MLRTNNLSLQRNRNTILQNLNLHIQPGKIVALLGRNGAGKSTLLKALAGEFHLQRDPLQLSGEIFLNDTCLTQFTAIELAKMRAVLPQNIQLAFPFNVMEVVMLGCHPYGIHPENPRIAMEALALAGASELAQRNTNTLSGGELARVQFARTLAQLHPRRPISSTSTRYLLLDEPTAALDLAHQHNLLRTLRQLAPEWNLGVLAIMHDPNLAARYADELAWLAQGTLLIQDTPSWSMTPDIIHACLGIEVEIMQSAGKPPFATVREEAKHTPENKAHKPSALFVR